MTDIDQVIEPENNSRKFKIKYSYYKLAIVKKV